MKWRSLILPVLIVIIIGGSAGFVANLYFSKHPILVTSGEDTYNILRDVIMILIAALTLFTGVLIAIVGWALRTILLYDLKSELGAMIKENENMVCCSLHGKVAPLWGRLFEYDRGATHLIEYAVGQAKQSLDYANKLDEKKHWELRLRALNNYLMALAEKGDPGDANEAYKVSGDLERLITEHEEELEPYHWKETVSFVRCRLPRIGSNDRERATVNFFSLEDAPAFGKWKKRWEDFDLIPKDTNPDKS